MPSEYTHVVQAMGKNGSWKNMTKHLSQSDAKKSVSEAKKASKTGSYRVVPYGEHKAMTAATKKSSAKPATAKTAKAPKSSPKMEK